MKLIISEKTMCKKYEVWEHGVNAGTRDFFDSPCTHCQDDSCEHHVGYVDTELDEYINGNNRVDVQDSPELTVEEYELDNAPLAHYLLVDGRVR